MDWAYLHYFSQLLETALADKPDGKARALASIAGILTAPNASAHAQIADLLDVIGREIDDPAFGFDLIKSTPLTSFGNGGLAVQTAPDFRAALNAIVDYSDVELLLYFFEYRIEDGLVWITIKTRYPVHEGYEIGLSAIAQSSSLLMGPFTGKDKNLTLMRTQRTDLTIADELQRNTGAKLEKGCEKDELAFPASILEHKNPIADPLMHSRLLQELQAEQDKLRKADISEYVRLRARSQIAAPPSQADLATSAGMSERSFRHLLSKQGTSYQKLVREVRCEFAINALKDGVLSIAEIGYRLGFADPSNFTSSFKRWTGKTPKDFRK